MGGLGGLVKVRLVLKLRCALLCIDSREGLAISSHTVHVFCPVGVYGVKGLDVLYCVFLDDEKDTLVICDD